MKITERIINIYNQWYKKCIMYIGTGNYDIGRNAILHFIFAWELNTKK